MNTPRDIAATRSTYVLYHAEKDAYINIEPNPDPALCIVYSMNSAFVFAREDDARRFHIHHNLGALVVIRRIEVFQRPVI